LSAKKRKSYDPYSVALRNRKKQANISRQEELQQQRAHNLGDPVRGVTTAFVQSFDTATPLKPSADVKTPQEENRLNYGLKPDDLSASLDMSKKLAVDRTDTSTYISEDQDAESRQEKVHKAAAAAIQRITALENGSSKNKMKVNIARCVNTFGRHNTDLLLPPKAPSLINVSDPSSAPIRPETNSKAATKRVGPDTGSSEVQIAILTAKIRTLADFLEKRGRGDKHNKRNLRLLVHRRQKLLQYLKRRERGGPRWQHCIETLGLTEGTYMGEISL
jgi:ribosomal protein S15